MKKLMLVMSCMKTQLKHWLVAKNQVDTAKSCIFYINYRVIDSKGKKSYEFIEPNYNDLSTFEYDVILWLIVLIIIELISFINQCLKNVVSLMKISSLWKISNSAAGITILLTDFSTNSFNCL